MAFVAKTDAVSAVSAATVLLTVPTHSSGDTLIAFVGGWDDAVGPTEPVPPNNSSGVGAWVLLDGISNGTIGGGLWAFARTANDAEPANYQWTWAAGTRMVGTMLSYSNPITVGYHADKTSTANDASGNMTTTITAHTKTFVTSTFVYGYLGQASGANFASYTSTPDAATTARGSDVVENSNCGVLNVADELVTGTTSEPARSWNMTWTESGGGHRSVLIRVPLLGTAIVAGDSWGWTG